MTIYLMTEERLIGDKIGGGNSFYRTFCKELKRMKIEYQRCGSGTEWDVGLCCGATMTTRQEWELAKIRRDYHKRQGRNVPLILRVDGIPEDWRNRGTGWPRFRDYAKEADAVIYQSEFIRDTVGRFIKRDGPVIYNGVDKKVFTPKGDEHPRFGNPSILYVNYRKAERNKRVEEAIERFRYFKLDNPEATMTFVGNFPKEQFLWDKKKWDFGLLDMKAGQDWQYLGIISDRMELAKIMRSCDHIAFPSFADPLPNTLIESMSCGLKPLWTNEYGGQAEIVNKWNEIDWSAERMVKEYLGVFEKLIC